MVGMEDQLEEKEEGNGGPKVVPVKLEHIEGVLQLRRAGNQSIWLGDVCSELFKMWYFSALLFLQKDPDPCR